MRNEVSGENGHDVSKARWKHQKRKVRVYKQMVRSGKEVTIDDMEPIAMSVFGRNVNELLSWDVTYDKSEQLLLMKEDVKTLRRKIKVHECRTLYRDNWNNAEVLTIVRAGFRKANYRMIGFSRAGGKRDYRLFKNAEIDKEDDEQEE